MSRQTTVTTFFGFLVALVGFATAQNTKLNIERDPVFGQSGLGVAFNSSGTAQNNCKGAASKSSIFACGSYRWNSEFTQCLPQFTCLSHWFCGVSRNDFVFQCQCQRSCWCLGAFHGPLHWQLVEQSSGCQWHWPPRHNESRRTSCPSWLFIEAKRALRTHLRNLFVFARTTCTVTGL